MFKNSIKKILGEKTVDFAKKIVVEINYLIFEVWLIRWQFILLMLFKEQKWDRRSESKLSFRKIESTDDRNIARNIRSTNSEKIKPRILFVTEKWCDCNPNSGITNSEHNLFGSLEASDLATQDRLHFDEYYYKYNRSADRALLEKCLEFQPSLIVITWLPEGSIFNPKWETLRLIKSKLKIPIVAIWFESISKSLNMNIAEKLLPLVDLNIVLDSTTAYLEATNNPEKYLPLWTPQDPRIFYNSDRERDIDISFVGSIHRQNDTERRNGIAALKAEGIQVFQAGGQRENRLSVDEYAEIIRRSKITLNFSNVGYDNTGGPTVQCKGRVFEATLSGAMLLESENSETAKWLEPMVDYVPFRDTADLVEKAKYYLENHSEREEIAARGYKTAMEKYTADKFWKSVFDRVLGKD